MAHVGAFDTGQVTPAVRYPYFIGLSLAGGLFSIAVTIALARRPSLIERPVVRVSAVIAAVTIFLTPLVWIMAGWLLNGETAPLRMVELARQVAPVVALLTAVGMFRPQPHEAPHSAVEAPEGEATVAPCAFRARLPPAIRTAAIQAVEGHDHYLRVHTDQGTALITGRLSDAVAILGGTEGAQTHRSWWVARDAVRAAKRSRGRAVLHLWSGLTVPVSRSFAPILRRSGWF